jgi:mannosyltransferase OCH1-like enzyme
MQLISHLSEDFDEPNNTPLIPNSLHMIWVGDNDAPAFFHEHVSAWRELMPDWTIRIWTNHDIREKNFEPDVLSQIKKATSGAQKADLMRYSIIERYGGVYMDADMIPRRALDPILCLGELVLCHDIPITWAYISNGFFAAIPHHPVLHTAVRLSKTAVLNTHHINMGTGPRLFGEAISTTPPGINRYINLPSVYFFRNNRGDCNVDLTNPIQYDESMSILDNRFMKHDFEKRFGTHTYAKMW